MRYAMRPFRTQIERIHTHTHRLRSPLPRVFIEHKVITCFLIRTQKNVDGENGIEREQVELNPHTRFG